MTLVAVRDFVGLCLAQRGDAYLFGVEVSPSDPDPSVFDCSELVEWACARPGVDPRMPDGSWNQLAHCRAHGLETSIAAGIATYGALLFMGRDGSEHVAVSLGNGMTIEARGRAYGVNEFGTQGRPWSAAARIPGIDYTEAGEMAGSVFGPDDHQMLVNIQGAVARDEADDAANEPTLRQRMANVEGAANRTEVFLRRLAEREGIAYDTPSS